VSIRDSDGGVYTSQERARGSLLHGLRGAHLRGGGVEFMARTRVEARPSVSV